MENRIKIQLTSLMVKEIGSILKSDSELLSSVQEQLLVSPREMIIPEELLNELKLLHHFFESLNCSEHTS